MRRLLSVMMIGLLWSCVSSTARTQRPAPEEDKRGDLWVYLQPLSSDASRLSFRLTALFAVRADDTKVPLKQFFVEVDATRVTEERKLASGSLPPGQYKGLDIELADAVLQGQEGPADLVSPEEPVRVDVAFRIEKRRAVVIDLRFVYRDSVKEEFRFSPAFVAEPAGRPAVGLLGLASSRADSVVTMFEKTSGKVVGVIPLGGPPVGMALDEGRQRTYAAIPGEDAVVSIDLLEYAVLNRQRLRSGDAPTELALTPDGRTLLSTNSGSRSVSFFDPASLVEIDRIAVGDEPRAVIVAPDGARAYVFNTASSTISVIDVLGRRLVGTIGTDAGPFRGQLNRDGDTLYVIHRLSPKVTVIDTATLALRSRIFVGPGALAITVDPQTDLIYLSRRGSGEIEVFDAQSLLPVNSIPVESDVTLMAVDVELNSLYALLPARGEVQAFGLVGNKLRVRAEVGDDPFWVVVSGERQRLE